MEVKNLKELSEKTNFDKIINVNDKIKGLRIPQHYINFIDGYLISDEVTDIKKYYFTVEEFSYQYYYDSTEYDVTIEIEKGEKIIATSCNCPEYKNGSCKHIAGVILDNYQDIFYEPIMHTIEEFSANILNFFSKPKENIIKKEVEVEVIIEKNNNYNISYLTPKVMIGLNKKMYSLGNHLDEFKLAFSGDANEAVFGKNFTYNSKEHYFSKDSLKIIKAFFYLNEGHRKNYLYDNDKIKNFLEEIKDIGFILGGYKIDKIYEDFPIETYLTKKNNKYELKFDKENIDVLFDDYEYVFYKGKLYRLNKEKQTLLKTILNNNFDKMEITNEQIDNFKNGLLNVLKRNIKIDENINEIVIPKDIVCELYFDLRNSEIIADPKFIYDQIEIHYFDKKTIVLRDMEFETNVVNDLLKYGFVIDKEKFIISDVDCQVSFIEKGLEELANDYVIYTTEKFKKIDIKKKTNITSMFKIGQDNILSYNFDLGNIKSDELVNIFKEIKNKKKYYRLKNGDILNLEDSSLQELEQLSDELELSDEEIIKGKGEVLKYRAIYLDSLKNDKFNIIKTDNLFDNFIKNFYKYKDANLSLTKKELNVLRDYQITGVKWLYNLYLTGFGGILADEMGLGKTIQIIYYIKQILKDNKNEKILIVVPTSLAYNWEHEFDLFAKEIKKRVCVGSKEKRKQILTNLGDCNVVITTYGILREDEEYYQNLSFHTMVIDEAQNIKNNLAGITKCVKKIKAKVKFALTGTPLENSLLELWSIFDFIMPGYLASLTKFQSRYRFKDYDEESEKLIKGLSKQINPFILRRKKNDVTKELPEKLINDIYIDLTDEQKKIYAAELEKVKIKMEQIVSEEGMSKARFLILQLLTKLRQICIDPAIVYDNYTGGSNKIDTLINTIEEYIANNHKILVFSSFRTALDIVKKQLEKKKIKYHVIDGSVSSKKRIEFVDDFNDNSSVKVFLMMLKSGGTGLNLTSADTVIHMDLWWNPQAENQATDRAHRIGQKKVVEVIHLITKGTIEEKILELQNKKRILSDKVIDGELRDKNILAQLTEKDIKNLLSYENKDY